MIDLDLLEQAVKKVWYTRSQEEDTVHSHVISELGILDIITRLRQAEKDAARYRWVIEQFWFQDEASWRLDIKESELSVEFSDDVGKAIDEAMQCK